MTSKYYSFDQYSICIDSTSNCHNEPNPNGPFTGHTIFPASLIPHIGPKSTKLHTDRPEACHFSQFQETLQDKKGRIKPVLKHSQKNYLPYIKLQKLKEDHLSKESMLKLLLFNRNHFMTPLFIAFFFCRRFNCFYAIEKLNC